MPAYTPDQHILARSLCSGSLAMTFCFPCEDIGPYQERHPRCETGPSPKIENERILLPMPASAGKKLEQEKSWNSLIIFLEVFFYISRHFITTLRALTIIKYS